MFHLGLVMLPLTCSWGGLGNTWNWHEGPKTGIPKLTWKILGGFEPTSPPRWLLHHLALISCTCQNLLECSFTCWEIPAAAVEGLEPPFQGPGFGNVPVPTCDPSPFQVGSVPPGDPGAIPAGSEPCRCAQVSLNVTWPCPTCSLSSQLAPCPSQVSSIHPGVSQRTCSCHCSPAGVHRCPAPGVPWLCCSHRTRVPGAPAVPCAAPQVLPAHLCSFWLRASPLASNWSDWHGFRFCRCGFSRVTWTGVHGEPTCASALAEALGSVLG